MPVISMYMRRIQCPDQRWALLRPSKYLFRPEFSDNSCFHSLSPKTTAKEYASHGNITRRNLLGSDSSRHTLLINKFSGLGQRCSISLKSTQLHAYSSESAGRKASEGGSFRLTGESLESAISRLMAMERMSKNPPQNLEDLAKGKFETSFISAVVRPGEIGVKFDDVGALEYVKKALNQLVILPMRRPELFTRGNLLQPCKGILLFGPPGTGKTLLAKALATEAGANFINVTSASLTSKWYGEVEKFTKALFSFARKLTPVIIFVDEVDSLLGARRGGHRGSRALINEFMAEWDGLRSKENQRILIVGATNRPFDLDDAVIRRMPRRIYVGLPDAENRMKILRIILKDENLDPDFQFDKLANLTDGYSGSDLKNLCVAAAYRPVQDLLDEEKTGGSNESTTLALRPLTLDDFIHSKSEVSPSVADDSSSVNALRRWNEKYGVGGTRIEAPFGF